MSIADNLKHKSLKRILFEEMRKTKRLRTGIFRSCSVTLAFLHFHLNWNKFRIKRTFSDVFSGLRHMGKKISCAGSVIQTWEKSCTTLKDLPCEIVVAAGIPSPSLETFLPRPSSHSILCHYRGSYLRVCTPKAAILQGFVHLKGQGK